MNTRMRTALEEIREVWAGSEAGKCGGVITETACEGYLQMLVKQCYQIAVEALKENNETTEDIARILRELGIESEQASRASEYVFSEVIKPLLKSD